MSRAERLPHWVYRLFNVPTRLYRFGFGQKVGPQILILTTTGRKSGLPRQTPLQYEFIDGVYYAGSMRGDKADWYRNILADPRVLLKVGERQYPALAEAIDDSEQVLSFLKYRLQRSPRMITAIMRADGLQGEMDDEALRNYAKSLTTVALRPSSADDFN
jgi:deazaflavin-dependent oxidoreductase (nitroreductase family)